MWGILVLSQSGRYVDGLPRLIAARKSCKEAAKGARLDAQHATDAAAQLVQRAHEELADGGGRELGALVEEGGGEAVDFVRIGRPVHHRRSEDPQRGTRARPSVE